MNGTTTVPGDILSQISGKDITLVLDMGNGITWSINGKSFTKKATGDIDFGVTYGEQAGKDIPVDVINNVTGERYAMNLTLAYDGEFGFSAVLSINMDGKNAGLYANLFYYNPESGELEFICAGQIGEDGNAELAFCQSDVMAYAYDGTNLFADTGAVSCFSTVAALYMEQVQIVTTDPEIKTVEDLKGKNVSIGAAGSGVYFNAMDVLGAYGMTEADINPTYQSFGDSADSLKNGQIDAAFIVAGAPTTAITDLSTAKETYLVSLDDEHVGKLLESSPYYTKVTIGKDVYGLDTDTITVAVSAVVLARDDVSEDAIYKLTADIFDNASSLTDTHAKYAEVSTEFGASVTSVPYHPGAAKYFAEKGFDVPTK